jgi:N-hydroxyarylamine O-acetyltransferase
MMTWYLSNHPDSRFVTQLVAARAGRRCRYTLHNTDFVVRHMDGRSERRVLRTAADLRETLTRTFGLVLPAGPALDSALHRLAARASIAAPSDSEEETHA